MNSAARRARQIAFSILGMLVTCSVQAKNDGTDPSATIEKEIQSWKVNTDGTFDLDHETVTVINEERAIRTLGQYSISYNRALETVDVIEAYTQKPDGRKVPVHTDQIKEQQEVQSSLAPMFSDTLVKVVIFPEVAVGDKLFVHAQHHRTTPLFPGKFEDLSYTGFYPVKQMTVTYDMPEAMHLNADARGFSASSPTSPPGRKIYRWDFIPGDNQRIEQNSVSYLDYGRRLAVSTFVDYGDMAHAYNVRASDKANVTPKITQLETKITAGLTEQRAKVLALTDWVRRNIRYVSISVAAGGVVPHFADTILDNLYGDCKDHATLLESLLSAAGIDSTQVLISYGNAYDLPTVPTLGILNHAITYVPALDLYLDSTNEMIAAGYIPMEEWEKPVLLVKQEKLALTPSVQPTKNLYKATIKITSDGNSDFSQNYLVTAQGAEQQRYRFRNMSKTDRDMFTEHLLRGYGLKGNGHLDVGDTEGKGKDYTFELTGHIENLVNFPGPVGMPAISSIMSGIASWVTKQAYEKERLQSYSCFSGETVEEANFELEKGIKVLGMPDPIEIHDVNFDYTADYGHIGNVYAVRRHLKFHHDSAVCTPEDFKKMKPVLDRMMRDLRGQIVVQS
jgi:transglutaminase-like putative cysteine protease